MSDVVATGVLPFDLVPPYRPGIDDFNGAQLEDDAEFPPDPTTMPTGGLVNNHSVASVAYGAVIPNATISVRYAAGAPFIDSMTCLKGFSPNGPQVKLAVNVERTPGGAGSGDIFLWWAAESIPPPVARPKATINGTTPGAAPAADWYTDSGSGNSGVRVVTQSVAGAATDLAFTVDVM